MVADYELCCSMRGKRRAGHREPEKAQENLRLKPLLSGCGLDVLPPWHGLAMTSVVGTAFPCWVPDTSLHNECISHGLILSPARLPFVRLQWKHSTA